jgi:hypothetical protein
LGAAIREIFGKYRVWPDYVVQPVSRFVNETSMETSMFLCVGVGDMVINQSDIRIGNTPISAFGTDVRYTLYPGATVSGDTRTENWFNSPEVGNTGSGTAAWIWAQADRRRSVLSLMRWSCPATPSRLLTYRRLAMRRSAVVDCRNGDHRAGTNSYTVVSSGGYSVIYGGVEELAPVVGMPVSLNYNGNDYDLVIASYAPGVRRCRVWVVAPPASPPAPRRRPTISAPRL